MMFNVDSGEMAQAMSESELQRGYYYVNNLGICVTNFMMTKMPTELIEINTDTLTALAQTAAAIEDEMKERGMDYGFLPGNPTFDGSGVSTEETE